MSDLVADPIKIGLKLIAREHSVTDMLPGGMNVPDTCEQACLYIQALEAIVKELRAERVELQKALYLRGEHY